MKHVFQWTILALITTSAAFSWGSNTHKFINKNSVMHLPPTMQRFIDSVAYLEKHSTDPDTRRNNNDTAFYSEQYRHYIDIDDYPNFKQLPKNLQTVIQTYGWKRVKENGVVFWATQWVMDSLTAQLKRNDWVNAFQTAADLGHYVADAHQPLHVAMNYNGQLSGNYGIHSRYETTMMNANLASIIVTKDSVHYISDPASYIFDYLIDANAYVDSVIAADRFAAPPSGYNGSGSLPADYYTKLWTASQGYTTELVKKSTVALANLWYTAYVNAGLLSTTAVRKESFLKPKNFNLRQNFPNPFNPTTQIEFDIAAPARTTLEIYSVDGKLVTTLVNAVLDAGSFSVEWDARTVPSGLYFYRLTAGGNTMTKKLVIVK